MHISIISDVKQFEDLKPAWNEVYQSDPNTTIFMSWPWIRAWSEITYGPWLVLALKPDQSFQYVAFLALGLNATGKKLMFGGNPYSDHAGFICLPAYEEQAISALGAHIANNMKWIKFELQDIFDPRLATFLNTFKKTKFRITSKADTPCPYINLPASWDEYLNTYLGARTRRVVRHCYRQIDKLDKFRYTDINETNWKNQIETVLTLWRLRWGAIPDKELNKYRDLLRICFNHGSLRLRTYWDDNIPIGANAEFIDRDKKAIFSYIHGFNQDYKKISSPGKVMMAKSIQQAIEDGFAIYDFCRGDESYKFLFGAKKRFNSNVMIQRVSWRRRIKELLVS
jgi:CelD/BcsL family acetyltransferase involved in cellulose biosynthesis